MTKSLSLQGFLSLYLLFASSVYAQEGKKLNITNPLTVSPFASPAGRSQASAMRSHVINNSKNLNKKAALSGPGASDVLVNDNAGGSGTAGFTQSETSVIAYGSNIVIGFNDAGSFPEGGNKFTGFSYSSDGGQTFTDGGTLPTNTIGDAGDPVLARNENTGRIYLCTLGFNLPYTNQMFYSDDDGVTWAPPVNATPGGNDEDKPWITVDNFQGSGNGNVYLLSRRFGGTATGIYFFKSTDDGQTFGPDGGSLIVPGNQGAFISVGPDHTVYAFWWAGSSIKMRTSTDFGETFGDPITVATGLVGGQNGDLGLTGILQGTTTPAFFRTSEFPHAAINPVNGNIYVTYDNRGIGSDKADIFYVMSTDGGLTWSNAVKVNDDNTTTDQWQPTIAVSPDGLHLGIFYYSREEDPDNNLYKYYGRIADIADSSVSFGPSFAVSDVASFPEFSRDAFINQSYMGDYNQASATADAFHVVWSDNRDDLPGGEPRKDPNIYYKQIPIVNPMTKSSRTALQKMDIAISKKPIGVIQNATINAFPNPNTGNFTLMLNNYANGKADIRIMNQSGAIVLRKSIDIFNKNQRIPLNLSSHNEGSYFIQIISKEGIKTMKFLVKH